MPDLADGQSVEICGSGRLPYVLKNVGGVYSCSCPAWRNQSVPIERRTCKHLRQYCGADAEAVRVGTTSQPVTSAAPPKRQVPPLLLAESWDGEQDVRDWWLSEKLDGVRAYWNGRQFLSRQGNVFHAPAWFTADLPAFPLDGELWLERQAFQRTVSIVRRHDEPAAWQSIRYVVFDAPMLDAPFESRLQSCRTHFDQYPAFYAEVLPQEPCRDHAHLHAELDRVTATGRRRLDAAAAGFGVRGGPLSDAAEGQTLPGRRGPRDRSRAGRRPPSRTARGATRRTAQRRAVFRRQRVHRSAT
jgi:DNA ligase-1